MKKIFFYLFRGNTEGWRCERCKSGYWGDPIRGCELCNCHQLGSVSNVCDVVNGQCLCQPRYGGHRCDECEVGTHFNFLFVNFMLLLWLGFYTSYS